MLLLVSNKLHVYEIPGMQIAAREMKRMGFNQDLYTNSDFMLTVRSGTRPDLPDFAVLGILVWAMTSQGHRTIRKWCSPAYNGYSFSRQMFMAKEDGGSRRAKRRSNTSGAWKSLRVLSPFNHIRFCGKTKIWFGHTWRIFNWNYIWSISSS